MLHTPHGAASQLGQPPKKGAALRSVEPIRGCSAGQPFPVSDRNDPIEALRERVRRRAATDRRIDIACKILVVIFAVLSVALVVSQ